MRYSIFFAIVLVLVSGFVAYFGDLLGRRMGKRRLTLFGLRPRYTAIGVTTITGMVIAALALITLISINKPFQRMFREGDQIIERNSSLTKANTDLEAKNRQLIARSLELEKTVAKWQKEVDEARKDVQNAQAARNAALEARNSAIAARNASLKSIASLKEDIRQRKLELVALRSQNKVAESELKLRQSKIDEVQAKLAQEQDELRNAQRDLATAIGKLTVANADLDKTEAQLAENKKVLEQQQVALDEQRKTIAEQQGQIVQMGKNQLQLESEFRRQAAELHSAIVRQGDELARGTVSDSGSDFSIRGDLLRILSQASKRAEALGASEGANGRAVKIVFRQLIDKDKALVTEDEQECIRMAIRAILGSNKDAMVQIVSSGNAIAGEQVPVELKLYENKLVFHEGWLISGTKLDGRISEGRILLSLIDFLRKDVSEEGLRAGIIPIANPNPGDSTGRDPVNQVDALMALVDEIKAANGPVKIQAYAGKNIYSAGPINMDNMTFKISKLE